MIQRNCAVSLMLLVGVIGFACASGPDTLSYKVTGPVYPLTDQQLGQTDLNKEPYSSGALQLTDVPRLLRALDSTNFKDTRPTIFHVLRWTDVTHSSVEFQRWYVFNPRNQKNGGFYAISDQKLFEDNLIPGETQFRLIFIHLSPISGGTCAPLTDSFNGDPSAPGTMLKHPISYDIDITKTPTQFAQDVQTLLGLLGVLKAAAPPAKPGPPPPPPVDVGYWGWALFAANSSSSTIKITPSTTDAKPTATSAVGTPGVPAANTAKSSLTASTFINQSPTYLGLSIGVPVTSYKDVTYQMQGGTLVPTSVTKQTAYAALDGYLPAALPGLMAVRYIPHPFIGLPLAGKVLLHPMAGLAVGFPWFEAYAGAVFDRENGQVTALRPGRLYAGRLASKYQSVRLPRHSSLRRLQRPQPLRRRSEAMVAPKFGDERAVDHQRTGNLRALRWSRGCGWSSRHSFSACVSHDEPSKSLMVLA